MMTMHRILDNFTIDEAIPATDYANTAAANTAAEEVDIEDAQNVVMYVNCGENSGDLTVTLQGADESDGSFSDLTATDGNTATITLDDEGEDEVEIRAEELKRYVKPNVEASEDNDDFCVVIVAGNYETLPVS